jgi:sulfur relay (sulfurtransferase) complex TusBCD TusD component (DsrE family)
LKFANTALKEGHSIDVFLVQGGVFCALSGQNPSNVPNNYETLNEVISAGGRIVCCGTCIKARGVKVDQIHPNIEVGTMNMFVDMVASADSVVNF